MLREAEPGDVRGIQRVRAAVHENRLVSRTISDAEVVDAITTPGKGWVVENETAIVGFGIANSPERNIWALFVEPGHERNGYGRLLHDAMVSWLFDQSGEPIWLSTEPGTRAEAFYVAAGWVPVGRTDSGEVRFERAEP
jgi:GNAT superfamily N-acetyltransferase